ncbi:hypothetical protein [Pseudohalioglobus lutimaris]|uniref:Uncharacterized protein n=1 Tax=Pseudohalioglobus lutimaris TaxID=1737061 RepID=A0A2N5WZK8_9GAMM|nr:hypothetical protein [Pseudohalioglobus lutimaris]PLW67673.1 hypothetical protein C0039_15850 [Pseudohalioglobus lutimaris]
MSDNSKHSQADEQLHWLVRPATIRKLWIGFSVVLALTVVAQSVIYVKGYFGIDAWFGFGAVYGFASCLLMVLVAKVLGVVLKRPGDYYQEPGATHSTNDSKRVVEESVDGT